jgi:uncharacterized protein (DUF885 family)
MMRLVPAWVLIAAAMTACSPEPQEPAPAAEPARLTAYLDAEYEEELAMSPEDLTALGRKEQYDALDDRSEAGDERRLEWRRKSVADMKASFNYEQLDDAGRTSFDIWAQELDRAEKRRAFRHHFYVFSRGGAHTGLPQFLISFHRVDTKADLEAYIARLSRFDNVFDDLIARAKHAAEQGIRPPAFAFAQALSEVKRLTTGAPFTAGPDSALFADVKAKADALRTSGTITAEERTALVEQASKVLSSEVRAGYQRVAAWLEADKVHAAAEAQGASALPDGANFYNTALLLQTTTTMTSDDIHALGLAEVARIRGEMEAIKTRVGFTGTLPEFFAFMRQDRQFYFPNTDEGRAAYIALAERYLGDMQKKLPEYFGILPKAGLVVKRVEPFREEPGGAQHYFGGTPDGSRPGIFYAHLSDMNAMPKFQLEDVAYHEGVPGHHLQISIAQERTGLPKFRTQYGYGAYLEGWGLYSEALSKEMGFFTDPYSDFGRLGGEIWRAIRLVVDTGLHAKGWTEGQAVAYFLENSPLAEGAIRSEVRRYLVNPGQATTYKIGMITIQRLRDEARRELGSKFDYRAFHDVVLGGGSTPLPVLESRVRRWIAAEKASAPRVTRDATT